MYDEALEKSGFKQRLEYLEIPKDNFETWNYENNYNNNVNNDNSYSKSRTVSGETNYRLNITGNRNNNDGSCRNKI